MTRKVARIIKQLLTRAHIMTQSIITEASCFFGLYLGIHFSGKYMENMHELHNYITA